MKKIISFSLFGNDDKYLVGMQRNIDLARQYYPGWTVIVYYKNVPEEFLKSIENEVTLRLVANNNLCGTMFRFLAHDEPDTERFIVRDADSRIGQREVDAVNEWVDSGKILHIMRDHPQHTCLIMGGMWGMICQPDFIIEKACDKYMEKRNPNQWFMTDQFFLRDVLYPKYMNNSKIHATYNKFEDWAEDFVLPLVDKKFVGEIWQADESRSYHKGLV